MREIEIKREDDFEYMVEILKQWGREGIDIKELQKRLLKNEFELYVVYLDTVRAGVSFLSMTGGVWSLWGFSDKRVPRTLKEYVYCFRQMLRKKDEIYIFCGQDERYLITLCRREKLDFLGEKNRILCFYKDNKNKEEKAGG